MDNSLCLCGSGKPSVDCCAQYIETSVLPKTPEQLMRSRYVAFATSKVDYILATERLEKPNLKEDMTVWCNLTDWKKLSVLGSGVEGDEGWVQFEAEYVESGRLSVLKERSLFEKVNGHWKYIGGDAVFEKQD